MTIDTILNGCDKSYSTFEPITLNPLMRASLFDFYKLSLFLTEQAQAYASSENCEHSFFVNDMASRFYALRNQIDYFVAG